MSNKMSFNQDLSPQQGMEGEEEGADDVVARALGITVILSKILSYMDFKHLKETRLVNHLWKAESEIYFKQRAQIDLIDSNRKLDKVDLEQFLEFCKSQQSFSLSLSSPYHEEILNYGNREILHLVLSSPPPLIKSLHLELSVRDPQDFILKINILNNLSYLKKLKLYVHLSESEEELDFVKVFQAVPQLPLVTKFVIHLNIDLKESDKPKVQKFCQKLQFMTPNLEDLSFINSSIDIIYFEQIVRLQNEWKDSKSNGPMPFQNLSFVNINASEKMLMSCLEFLQPLKGLEIYRLRAENEFALQKILNKNSKTLEALKISDIMGQHPTIILPVLPRLKRLYLKSVDVYNLPELLWMSSDTFHSRFPKLQALILYNPKNYLPRPNCQLDLFFPQFTSLEITCNWCFNSLDAPEWIEWMSKLFPNVHNPWINKARENIQARM